MPNMDGLSLIKVLRTMKNCKNVPIVMLTAEFGDDVKAQDKAAGVTGWMFKPFDLMRLQKSPGN